eukprot:8421552-Pyramimonas_sp.AAC.1
MEAELDGSTYDLCSPDYWARLCLPPARHEQQTETSDHTREQTIRQASTGAIRQTAAIAKTSRAPRTKTTIAGPHYYSESD